MTTRRDIAYMASGRSVTATTGEVTIAGVDVQVTSGGATVDGYDWCAIGQLGFAYDGRRLIVGLLCMPAVTRVVQEHRARRRARYGTDGDQVTRRHRAAWELRVGGMSPAGIARELDVHVEMVRKILRRYRRHLESSAGIATQESP